MILAKLLRKLFSMPFAGKKIKTVACAAAFSLSNFDLTNTGQFNKWFDDESVAILSQAGEFKGIDDITEYVNFIYSEYFSSYVSIRREYMWNIMDDSEHCTLTILGENEASLSDSFFNPGCLDMAVGTSFEYYLTDDDTFITVTNAKVYYPTGFLGLFFGGFQPNNISTHVCSIMKNTCEYVWIENNLIDEDSCKETFISLPVAESSELSIDGYSQGCRILHASFAAKNSKHCPHISFVPMKDLRDEIKCQVSENIKPEDIFKIEQLTFFKNVAMNSFGFEDTLVSYTSGSC